MGVALVWCAGLLAGRGWAPSLARAAEKEALPFGLASFSMQSTQTRYVGRVAGQPGSGFVEEPYAFTQAGGHPASMTTTVEFAGAGAGAGPSGPATAHAPKHMVVELPPGLLADPQAVGGCAPNQVFQNGSCPTGSQIGVFTVHALGHVIFGPIVNVIPETGQAAELALVTPSGYTLPMTGRLTRTPTAYTLAVTANLPADLELVSVQLTFWGVPAAASHDPERGLRCEGPADAEWTCTGGAEHDGEPLIPYLTMPSDCAAGPLAASVQADSWLEPGRWVGASATMPPVTGCNRLRFAPSLEVQPDTLLADAPLGLSIDIGGLEAESAIPSENATASAPVREASVTLPQGVSISPAVGEGVLACPASGPEGLDMPTGVSSTGQPLTPEEVGEGEARGQDELKSLAPAHCPDGSRIGEVEARTPLLAEALKGSVYLAEPMCGNGQAPCTEQDALDGTLYRVYVELAGVGALGGNGIDVKIAGYVQANPASGQLTVRLLEAPQLPLSQLTLKLRGGPGALLASQPTCPTASTSSWIVSWSAPGRTPEGTFAPGTVEAAPTSSYALEGCPATPTLAPGFTAGTLNPFAGSSSPFALSVARNDREQYLERIQTRLPAGVIARLAGVQPCGEQAAREADCPTASRIGSSLVEAGAGSEPLRLSGDVYLTGPYEGSPFGLALVTPAHLGPFDLGKVLIRARVGIDPRTAALTIASDPLPQIVLGVPLRLRRVNLTLDRAGFILNPTDCASEQVTATVTGVQGASARVAAPFAAAECRSLPFKPSLSVAAYSRRSHPRGVGLALTVSQPASQANIAKIELRVPSWLAIRSSALEHACPEKQLLDDPGGCPSGSVVGYAVAHTPVLSKPLAGPMMLVARPGRQLPRLEVVLQGEGVQLLLTGATRVSRAGQISSGFEAMPDVPIGRIQLVLPEGPHSAFASNRSLCTVAARASRMERAVPRSPKRRAGLHGLLLPVRIVGQNGAVMAAREPVRVLGCRAKA